MTNPNPVETVERKPELREITWPSQIDRDELRRKQDRIIELAEKQGLPFDVPISEVQMGAPTVLQLHSTIWPDYEPSIDSCLRYLESQPN